MSLSAALLKWQCWVEKPHKSTRSGLWLGGKNAISNFPGWIPSVESL